MENDVLMVALAGLLHDIGKFAQRAGEQVTAEWSDPKTRQDFGYQHALHTWHFVEKYLPVSFKEAGTMAAFHHRPKGDGRLIQIADHLAASERRNSEIKEDTDRKIHPKQVQSIFCSITTKGKDAKGQEVSLSAPNKVYLPLAPLKLDRAVLFPGPALADEAVWKQYKLMWDAFCREADLLKKIHNEQPDLEAYLESMLDLLQRYTWSIPSAYFNAVPDVSLYDHSRMTAALASILAGSGLSQDELNSRLSGKSEQPLVALIGGDISGVQDFIYTVTSKAAARTLRGRSFYLQLLTEAALRFILGKLKLPYVNVIYSGGGNFFLLAPHSALEALPAIRAELSRMMIKHHGTSLYLALGAASLPAAAFELGKLPEYWDNMHRSINLAKQQRYSELGADMHASIFAPAAQGGNPQGTCSVCGDDQRHTTKWDELENQERICSLCRSFAEDIGKKLPSARFLALGLEDPSSTSKSSAGNALAELGLTFQFLDSANEKISLRASRTVTWALDDPANGGYPAGSSSQTHLLRYTANQVPAGTLDDMKKMVDGGFVRLGVIRMDVDNVGELFKHGLGSNSTLSRIAALSSSLSFFFEGWIKQLCASGSRADSIYTVYTGGDDGFLLGPWDIMPKLAQEIASDFANYTAGHAGISLSAGMSFIHGKYPIYQAAEDADEALQDAKQAGKNRFHFLGDSWPWAAFKLVDEKYARILHIIKDLKGPHALIQTLRILAEQKNKKVRELGPDVWGPWQWRGTYLLTRMEERSKGKSELEKEIAAIRNNLDANNYSELNQWSTAARWAQLFTREEIKKEE